MMTTPKRYEPDVIYGGFGDSPAPMMSEHPGGDYVHHDDYQQLAAKLVEVTDEYCAAEKVIIDLIEARDELAAKLAEAEAERDRYKEAVQEMVDKAAANKLEGYRELGRKAAQAETERDEARQQLTDMTEDRDRVAMEAYEIHTKLEQQLAELRQRAEQLRYTSSVPSRMIDWLLKDTPAQPEPEISDGHERG